MRTVAYREIRRFGYLKTKLYLENPTGFISEDEETEKSKENKEHVDHLAWFKDFNNKMLKTAMKL